MMGHEEHPQEKLFYYHLNLEDRIRWNHPLRKMKELVDFDFVYGEVRESYGDKGNVSVPPPVILKLMLLLVFYNVRSERELLATVPERIDWLWFLGYDLDSDIPDHSVLSKARRRWGADVFKSFFERIVLRCVEAGLVDGSKIFMDSSLIDADASNNSVVDTHSLKRYLNKGYEELEKRLEEKRGGRDKVQDRRDVNNRYISTTDPDAAIVKRGRRPRLQYQGHRAVDGAYEIITATEVTPGDVHESHLMASLLDSHQENAGKQAETVVADSKYGTIENYLTCYDRDIQSHMPDLKKTQDNTGSRKGIFPDKMFVYDKETDSYLCPAGKVLKRKGINVQRQSVYYRAKGSECKECHLQPQCTRGKLGREIKRHDRQEDLEKMRTLCQTKEATKDIKTRMHLMERSFARAKRYGFKRARWRGLWRVRIQEYLIAAVQNIEALMRYGVRPKNAVAMAAIVEKIDTHLPAINFFKEKYFPKAVKNPFFFESRGCAPLKNEVTSVKIYFGQQPVE